MFSVFQPVPPALFICTCLVSTHNVERWRRLAVSIWMSGDFMVQSYHDTVSHICKVCHIKYFEKFLRVWLSHFRFELSFYCIAEDLSLFSMQRLFVCVCVGGRVKLSGGGVCVCAEMHVLGRKWWSHPLWESERQREWHRAFRDELSVGRVGRALWLCFVFVSRSLECSARCSCRSCSAMCFTGASAVWNSGRETRR